MQSHASFFKFFSNARMIMPDLICNLFLLNMLPYCTMYPSWPTVAVPQGLPCCDPFFSAGGNGEGQGAKPGEPREIFSNFKKPSSSLFKFT
jgi:hypothetical protein